MGSVYSISNFFNNKISQGRNSSSYLAFIFSLPWSNFCFHFLLAILKFLQDLSTNVLKEEPQKLEDPQVKYFVCATIRILGAWLSEETQASYRSRFFSTSLDITFFAGGLINLYFTLFLACFYKFVQR